MKSSLFSGLTLPKPVEVVEVRKRFFEDKTPYKRDLSIGGYLNDRGRIHLFSVVRKVENEFSTSEDHGHGYLPSLGYEEVNQAAMEVLFGPKSQIITEGRAFCVQSIGGTGTIRIGADLLRDNLGFTAAVYSEPTWSNHKDIFLKAGFEKVNPYPYWSDNCPEGLDFPKLINHFKTLERNTVVVLHAAAHNPTGIDPTRDQWREICTVVKERGLFPFFDCAYQGFATGDLEGDAWPVRYFAEQGLEMLVSQSFGKNMGLYGERIGFLSGVVANPEVIPMIKAQLIPIVRPMYSNPAGHGAKIVGRILKDNALMNEWQTELTAMVARVVKIRRDLRALLEVKAPSRDWSMLTKQIGMFYYSGLSEAQGCALATRHHIYMLPTCGRINVGAITDGSLEQIADALADVVNNPPRASA